MEKRTGNLIQYLIEQRDYTAAEKIIGQALELESYDAQLYYFRGFLDRAKGNLSNSIRWWKQGLACNINHPDLLVNLGIALCEKGVAEQGIGYLSRFCQLKAYETEQICSIIEAMKRNGLYDEAIRLLTSHWRRLGTSLKIVFALGKLYFEIGQFEPAISHFKRALADPQLNSEASNLLCYIFESLYTGGELVRHIENLIPETQDRTDLYFNLGMILGEQHDYDESIRYLYLAVKSDPSDPSVKETLDEICQEKIDIVLNANPKDLDETAWLKVMVAFLHLRDDRSAAQCLSQAKKRNRDLDLEDIVMRFGLLQDRGYLGCSVQQLFS